MTLRTRMSACKFAHARVNKHINSANLHLPDANKHTLVHRYTAGCEFARRCENSQKRVRVLTRVLRVLSRV